MREHECACEYECVSVSVHVSMSGECVSVNVHVSMSV